MTEDLGTSEPDAGDGHRPTLDDIGHELGNLAMLVDSVAVRLQGRADLSTVRSLETAALRLSEICDQIDALASGDAAADDASAGTGSANTADSEASRSDGR